MKSIVIKTAVKTLIAAVVALLIAFGIASVGFPRSMSGICENTGNYWLAARYASLSFIYTGDIDDLWRGAENGRRAGDNAKVIEFNEKMTKHSNFGKLCAEKGGEPVRQYVYANLAQAKYSESDKQGAVNAVKDALDGVDGFPKNNALAVLAVTVSKAGDKATADMLYELMKDRDDGSEYFSAVERVLKGTGGN